MFSYENDLGSGNDLVLNSHIPSDGIKSMWCLHLSTFRPQAAFFSEKSTAFYFFQKNKI